MAKQLEQRMRRVYEEMALNKIIGKQESCYTLVVKSMPSPTQSDTLPITPLPPPTLPASHYSVSLPLLLCLPPPTLSAPFPFL
jgi:hypothetical protein